MRPAVQDTVPMKYKPEPPPSAWAGLRSRLAAIAWFQPKLVLQCAGMLPREAELLEQLLQPVGAKLGLRLTLQPLRGEVVVIEQGFALKMPPAALESLVGGRPLVAVGLDVPQMLGPRGTARLFESRQRQLLHQLSSLPIVRERCAKG